MRIIFTIIGVVAIVIVIGTVLRIAFLPMRAVDRGLGTAEGIIDETLNADNALYNYEWFKQTHEDIKAIEAKISIAMQSVDGYEASLPEDHLLWSFEMSTEWNRLRAVEQGLRSQYEQVVANYNARSEMANRAIFKDGLIPSVIEMSADIIR